jgi:hypothetical protein
MPEAALAQGALASWDAAYPRGELESLSPFLESGAHFIAALGEEEEEEEEEKEDFALTLPSPPPPPPPLLLPARSLSEGGGAAASTFLAGEPSTGAAASAETSLSWFLPAWRAACLSSGVEVSCCGRASARRGSDEERREQATSTIRSKAMTPLIVVLCLFSSFSIPVS